MPFRTGMTYLTARDLDEEKRALRLSMERAACRNPFKRAWWWLTRAHRQLEPEPDPPSSWKRYPRLPAARRALDARTGTGGEDA